jgi:hypothetical protein
MYLLLIIVCPTLLPYIVTVSDEYSYNYGLIGWFFKLFYNIYYFILFSPIFKIISP